MLNYNISMDSIDVNFQKTEELSKGCSFNLIIIIKEKKI